MKYSSYSQVGVSGKFVLCFHASSNDDLTKHSVYLYAKVISPIDEFVVGDVAKNVETKMYETLVPNSNITSDNYCNIVEDIIRNEGSRILKLL